MSHKQDYMKDGDLKLKLRINDKKIPLVPFIHNAIRDSILGILKNLKGFDKGKLS